MELRLFREKPTVMEAINKRMNVVVNFLYSSIIGRPPIYFLVQVLKLNSMYVENIKE